MGRDRSPKTVVVVIFKFNLVYIYVKIIFLFNEWTHSYQKLWENGWDNAFTITGWQPSLTLSRSWWAQPQLQLH